MDDERERAEQAEQEKPVLKQQETEPCLGPKCAKRVAPDAPWGRFLVDGKYRGVCGARCNTAYIDGRWLLFQDAAD